MEKIKIEEKYGYIWYPGDFLSSADVDKLLTLSQELWYRRALDYAWLDDGLSGTFEEIARRIKRGCTVAGITHILKIFFTQDKRGVWRNKKQEHIRKQLKQTLVQKKLAGKASGRKRTKTKGLSAERAFNGRSTGVITADEQLITLNSLKKEFTNVNSKESQQQQQISTQPIEDFLAVCRNDPKYAGIDVDVEAARAEAWAIGKDKRLTRRLLTNWLNRAEPTVTIAKKPKPPTLSPDEIRAREAAFEAKYRAGPPPKLLARPQGEPV